jgi:hypothetical protein
MLKYKCVLKNFNNSRKRVICAGDVLFPFFKKPTAEKPPTFSKSAYNPPTFSSHAGAHIGASGDFG